MIFIGFVVKHSFAINITKASMPENKPWTDQEDKAIRELFQIKKISKWSTIAQKMADEYHLPGRNGKQCRQRYQTALEPTFVHLQWTKSEEEIMYRLHDQIGNKWAQIAQKMPGRTDNCIKNHFYSNLRQAIRKLNKFISQHFKPTIKQIRPVVLYKIIEATDAYFKLSEEIRSKLPFDCGKIKNRLLLLGEPEFSIEKDLEFARELAQMIHNFSKDYKRKPKKDRRGVAQSMNLKGPPKIEKYKFDDDLDDYDPDKRPVSEGQHDHHQHSFDDLESQDSQIYGEKQKLQEYMKETPGSHKRMSVIEVSGHHSLNMSVHQETQSKGIEMRLQTAGLLNNSVLSSHPMTPNLMNTQPNLNNSLGSSYHLIPIQFPFFNPNPTGSIYIPFFKQSMDMSMSMSMESEYLGGEYYQQLTRDQRLKQSQQCRDKDRTRVGFHLGESMEKLKSSFVMRQSADIDAQSNLFKSN